MNALPILYSFRRCPYAMRARMAHLGRCGHLPVSLREVVLRRQTPSHAGGVSQGHGAGAGAEPTAQVIEESLDCHYATGPLEQNDPEELAGRRAPATTAVA